ncbi:unnamed protein product, partial [Owenia fusiformis]
MIHQSWTWGVFYLAIFVGVLHVKVRAQEDDWCSTENALEDRLLRIDYTDTDTILTAQQKAELVNLFSSRSSLFNGWLRFLDGSQICTPSDIVSLYNTCEDR